MKKIIFSFFLFTLFSVCVSAQMSDDQVMIYVKQEYQKGTSQEVIATNLLKRGVSQTQLERIKKQQESKQLSTNTADKSSQQLSRERAQDPELELSPDHIDEIKSSIDVDDSDSSPIFGHNIFNQKNLTFNPIVNIPTPVDYRLGPNDEVVIDIWGASQNTVRQTITPDGSITVDRLGPIYLNGMTISEANDYVQKKFGSIYSGISSGEEGISSIKLTLGQIRTIQLNVMGEVVAPGTYSLSSLSSVFHALYRAGGVNKIGSLRSIKLYRNNKLIKTIDVYKYILDGKLNDDVRLADGDVIIVPTYNSLVNISGSIKRPMYYEMTATETVDDLIKYSGGFKGDAYKKYIQIYRKTGSDNKIFTLTESESKTFTLDDEDFVSIGVGLGLFENRVEIKGAVFRGGYYEIGNGITTVKQLIAAADGVQGDAFLSRAVLTREKEDLKTEIISIDIRDLLYEGGTDIVLRKNDVLYIPSINELQEVGDITIFGQVARPGSYQFSDNTTLEDLIIKSGGLLESASSVKVDVARRIIDPYALTQDRTLSENFTFALKDGLVIDGEQGFVLKPFDQVYVRKSPGYHAQKNIFIEGEVLFPGAYALNKKTERISDVVKRAGNLTFDAYPEGARLVRQQNQYELFRDQALLRLSKQDTKDSISVKSLDLSKSYNVGIELNLAMKNPGSDYDLVLREGDRIIIPEYDNTVKINGAVMYPNTVVYKKGEKIAYYINQAGGYADNAKKNKAFVLYMNGTVSKVKGRDRNVIQPGSEIVIPTKEQSKRLSLAEIVSMGSSVTSMASVVALLINSLSK